MIKALWHLSTTKSAINHSTPTPIDEPIQIKSLYSLISAGTERLVASGNIPDSLHESMRVPFMQGDFNFPLTYGYSLVGEVLTQKHPLKGKLVHLMHPHQDFCQVAPTQITAIPDGIPAARASLASNLETALNAIWDSNISIGDRVVVIGFGMIGALVARLVALMPAVELSILELDEARKAKAQEMGFSLCNREELAAQDIAFHTSGTSAGLQTAIESLGLEGKVIELSWYGNAAIQINLGGSFHQQRKQIISSQVSIVPTVRSSRWDYARRKQTVFELLKQSVFDHHITDILPFEETPAFFDQLRNGQAKGLGYLIKY